MSLFKSQWKYALAQTPFGGERCIGVKKNFTTGREFEQHNVSYHRSEVSLEPWNGQTNRAFIISLWNECSLLGHRPVSASTFAFFFPPHKNSVYLISKAYQGQAMQIIISVSSALRLFINKKKKKVAKYQPMESRAISLNDGTRWFSVLPWSLSVFVCYEEQTSWFVIPQWKNTLIKPSAHRIPVVFCSWMLSLEGLIVLHPYLPKTHVCAGWRASAIHFHCALDLYPFVQALPG